MWITEPKIENYCQENTSQPHPSLSQLTIETQRQLAPAARMQVGPLEGQFLKMLTSIARAKTVLEFGTFTGYSSTCFALAVGPEGRVTTLDRDPSSTQLAQKAWAAAGVESRVEFILGSALESADRLLQEIEAKKRPYFDLVFIDADKGNYKNYLELSLKITHADALILVDNVLWSGEVLDPQDAQARTIVEFNDFVRSHPGLECAMVPVRDGLTLIQKKK